MATLGMLVLCVICLVTVLTISRCSGSEDVNGIVDEFLARANKKARRNGSTYFHTEGALVDFLFFDDMTILGLDSLKRTGDTLEYEPQPGRRYYSVQVGFESLQIFFNRLCSGDECTSASFIIDSSSVRIVFTLSDGTVGPCSVHVDEAFLENASKITLTAANPKFRYLMYEIFRKYLVPAYSDALAKPSYRTKLDAALSKLYCSNELEEQSELLVCLFFLFWAKNC